MLRNKFIRLGIIKGINGSTYVIYQHTQYAKGTANATAVFGSSPFCRAAGIAIQAAKARSLGMFPPASILPCIEAGSSPRKAIQLKHRQNPANHYSSTTGFLKANEK